MNSVKFGEKDSFKDWGLILKPKSRPFPTPKTTYVTIEGKDGDLDLTTSLTDDVKYNNYTQSLEFTLNDKRENWEAKMQEITTYLQGKKLNVVFSEDAEWYAIGRMSVNELKSNKNIGSIVIDCNFEPYRLKANETIIDEPIEAGKVIPLSNSRKWVMPTFVSHSKNLFDKDNANVLDASYIDGNGSIEYGGWHSRIVYIKCKPNTKYTISKQLTTYRFVLCTTKKLPALYSKTLQIVTGSGNDSSLTITTEKDAEYLCVWCIKSDADEYTMTEILAGLQIEKGEIATEYEAFSNTSSNFTFEETEFSFSGTLKTPSIILKEGTSEITLNSGEGYIEISYREGKL